MIWSKQFKQLDETLHKLHLTKIFKNLSKIWITQLEYN